MRADGSVDALRLRGPPAAMTQNFELFVACLPGLETLVADECRALDVEVETPRVGAGGVTAHGDGRAIAVLNLGLACASHVFLRLARFRARHFGELCRKTARVEWRRFLPPDVPFAVRATAKRSKLFHSDGLAERVASEIVAQLGTAVASEGEPVDVVVRMEDDLCTLSLDSSGRPLHERGWRLETGKAPLREDLAAALVRASGWDPDTTLVDPMCGSGTIVIEAAGRARGLAPGRLRSFAFERLTVIEPGSDSVVRAEFARRARAAVSTPLFGSDRDAGVVALAARNAERAGVAADVVFTHAPVSAAPGLAPPTARGAVVCNPPFGKRIAAGRDLGALWQTLGTRVRALGPGWIAAFLAADRRLALRSGLPLRSAFLANHGGLRVRGLVAARVTDVAGPDGLDGPDEGGSPDLELVRPGEA